MVDKNMRTTK